ncbi:MAG: energy-coupling factor transporter ATPase [Desulfitobacteriaceae bacterium]|nr:energy-coupling factor transporter ATPase [Desulfitobacteriaceae bacterium]MDI6879957.1 energy-coupling factor transporter ATPase [Desulfitobacteriaceae bacterium]MDI6914792.1 energy-coupling factor transporter ATPase [Desulfitobacteriaceae bacterium]
MAYAIELEDVSYRYQRGERDVLQNISLTIEKGSFVVLMGAAGAGKTTLSLLLNGIIPQLLEGELRGKVMVAGRDVSGYPVQALAQYVGLVLQDPESQIFGLTVEEDVAFGLRNFQVPQGEIRSRVEEALKRVGLEGFNARETATLSGGEKQRLAIAGMLVLEPEILVLDEPTAELDPIGRTEVYRVLEYLRRDKGLTLLVIEHSPENIVQVADHILVIQDGKLVWQGEPGTLLRQIPLLNVYGIRPLPTAEWGYALYEQGMLSFQEIPLSLAEAEAVIERFAGKRREWVRNNLGLEAVEQKRSEDGGMQQEPLIRVRQLEHDYPSGTQALLGVDLDIYPGEFVALVGQNGAGKTTLAKHLNALLKPLAGQVLIAGRDTRHSDTGELARLVGFVFQNPDHQIFAPTIEQELEYGLRNVGLEKAEISQRVTEALDQTGLTGYRNIHPFALGKGERQLIALASVLALKPKILVVDEPTTGLDWQGTQKMMEFIRSLHETGTTVVMVTHDMELVARYAERVVVMQGGRVVHDGLVSGVFALGDALRDAAIEVPTLVQLEKILRPTTSGEGFKEGRGEEVSQREKEISDGKQGASQGEQSASREGQALNVSKGRVKQPIKIRPKNFSEQGFLQRFDVRVRFLLLLVGTIISFMFTDPRYGSGLALAALGLALNSRFPLGRLKGLFLTLLPMFVMIGLFTGFSTPTALFQHKENRIILGYLWTGGQGGLSVGGVLLSATFFLRVFSLVLLSSLLTWSTTVEEFLFLLKTLRFPEAASFVIITALRFIPTLDRKRQRILEAQRARGAQFRGRGIIRKVREYLPLMVPLLNGAILMADSLAMAMLNRGFGYTQILQETERGVLHLKDYVAMSILMLLTVGAFYLRFGLQRGML